MQGTTLAAAGSPGVTILMLAIWIGLIALCVSGARKRGRGPGLWGVLGALFGVFAWATLYILPTKAEQVQPEKHSDTDLDRIAKLHELHSKGAIGSEEFEYQKLLVLRGEN